MAAQDGILATGWGGVRVKHIAGKSYASSSPIFERRLKPISTISKPQTKLCVKGAIRGGQAWPAKGGESSNVVIFSAVVHCTIAVVS